MMTTTAKMMKDVVYMLGCGAHGAIDNDKFIKTTTETTTTKTSGDGDVDEFIEIDDGDAM